MLFEIGFYSVIPLYKISIVSVALVVNAVDLFCVGEREKLGFVYFRV